MNETTAAAIGKIVTVYGVGGYIRSTEKGDVTTSRWQLENGMTNKFQIEHVDGNWVAFRVMGTNLYLTQHLYGDEARAELATTLLENAPQILPELLPHIIEYLADESKNSFEGEGFNYRPMTAMPGPPNAMQHFELVPETNIYPFGNGDEFGVRSRFGKFWRSEHWNHVVSQSSHLLGDETWTFYHDEESDN